MTQCSISPHDVGFRLVGCSCLIVGISVEVFPSIINDGIFALGSKKPGLAGQDFFSRERVLLLSSCPHPSLLVDYRGQHIKAA